MPGWLQAIVFGDGAFLAGAVGVGLLGALIYHALFGNSDQS